MKKTLALILALVMCFSLFAIGASAATEEFTDKAEIEHIEAVNLLVALGVINGMGDGTFGPDGIVTRAQMAQIVAKICNGGKLPNVNASAQTFSDVPTSHWAFQAVEYCVGKGIVAGMGDGTFNPDAQLTPSQCAKMLLVAMGYNETAHKLTGASWEIYTAIYANSNDFYEEIEDVNVSAPITREHVAQMVNNMLEAPIVEAEQEIDSNGVITTKYSQTNANGTADNDDVVTEYFGALIEYGYLTGSSYNKTKEEWTYKFSAGAEFGGDAIDANDDPFSGPNLKSKVDYVALTGRKVCVVYDEDDNSVIYDVYADEDSTVVASAIIDDIDDLDLLTNEDEITVADVDYDLDAAAQNINCWTTSGKDLTMALDEIYLNTGSTGKVDLWCVVKFIDNTGDDKIDAVLIQPATIAKITALTNKTISMATYNDNLKLAGNTTGLDLDDEDWVFNADLEKKDYVVIKKNTKAINVVTPMEEIAGEAIAVKDANGSGYEKAKVDGVYYNFYEFDGTLAKINTDYEFFGYNGFAFDVTKKGAGSTDLLLLKEAAFDDWGDVSAKVMFPDGTTKTVVIADGDLAYGTPDASVDDEYLAADEVVALEDILFTYEVNKDDEYELTELVAGEADEDNHAGFDGFENTTDTFQKQNSDQAAKLADMIIDDNAVVMVKYDDGDKYTVVTGAALKTYTLEGAVSNVQVLYDEDGGVDKVQFAFFDAGLRKSFGSDDIYAYVVDVTDTTKIDGTTYTNCVLWTVDGEVPDAAIDAGNVALDDGDCIVLTQNSDGTYDLEADNGDFTEVAITGYSESDNVITLVEIGDAFFTYNSLTFNNEKLPESVTVLNVDTDAVEGITVGEIEVADDDDLDRFTTNAMVYLSDEDTMCLIIDIANNDWNIDTDLVVVP